jgi:hypothetical protein
VAESVNPDHRHTPEAVELEAAGLEAVELEAAGLEAVRDEDDARRDRRKPVAEG